LPNTRRKNWHRCRLRPPQHRRHRAIRWQQPTNLFVSGLYISKLAKSHNAWQAEIIIRLGGIRTRTFLAMLLIGFAGIGFAGYRKSRRLQRVTYFAIN